MPPPIKANLSQELNLDMMLRTISLGEIFDEDSCRGRFEFHGAFRQEFIDLVAMKITLPSIYFIEDRDGTYYAAGEYANDFLTSLDMYIGANDDARHLIRRAKETRVEAIIIRCNNTTEQVKNLSRILSSLKVVTHL